MYCYLIDTFENLKQDNLLVQDLDQGEMTIFKYFLSKLIIFLAMSLKILLINTDENPLKLAQ